MVRMALTTRHPIFIFWGQQHICIYNDAFSASLGPEKHPSILGASGRAAWSEIWEIIGPQIEMVMRGEGSTWHENHLVPILRHGTIQDVYWTYSYGPIDDRESANGIGGVLVICTETTAQINLERRLLVERERLAQLFDQAPTFMALLRGPDHIVELANPGYMSLIGKRPVLGRTVADALPEAVEQGYLKLLNDVYASGEAYSASAARFSRLESDGVNVDRYVDFVYQPIKDSAGAVNGIFVVGADVTARTVAEQTVRSTEAGLRSSEQQLRLATDAAEVGFWDVDLLGDKLFWPDRVKAMFGISPGVSVSMQDFYDGLHPDDREQTRAAFIAAASPVHRSLYDVEYRTIGKEDGVVRWVAAKGRGLFDNEGKCVRVVGTAIDISRRKETETNLRESEARLKDADRRKDEFLAMLAHELRNPLAPIRNAAEFLWLISNQPERVRETSEIIVRQARHMAEIVDDLLDVSRVTRGLVSLQSEIVDLRQIVTSAIEQCVPLIDARRHRLGIDLPDRPAFVHGDRVRLIQIFSNLINNAAKYTAAGGSVRISVVDAADQIEINIVDSGEGIDAALLPRVFDLFAQGQRSPDRSQGGLGVGLSLAKTLVQLHGGTIGASSQGSGQGSCFTVKLPRSPVVPDSVSNGAAAAPMTASSRSLRLLVVDDNVDAAECLANILELDGHSVLRAHDARGAMAFAQTAQLDAMMLDIGLPVIDGYELARKLRALPEVNGTTLIAVSGYGQPEDRARAADAGFDHYLVKPVDLAALRILLNRAT